METWFNYIAIYVAVAYVFLRIPLPPRFKDPAFAGINIAFTFSCFFYLSDEKQWPLFLFCMAAVLLFYMPLYYYSIHPQRRVYTVALLAPIIMLALIKTDVLPVIVGFSYLAFRLSYLAYELRSRKATLPSLARYLSFAFFPPTFLVGPISPYSYYGPSLDAPDRNMTPLNRSLGRVLVGMIKCILLASFFKTMSFTNMWFDNYYHGLSDFIVACVCTQLYFYFNFSGSCDIIIGAAGLLNIRVKENFDNLLMARNLREFWNRAHITLSHFLRDIVFTPGVVSLSRLSGGRHVHLITVCMILVTFFLMGIWHGIGLNFIVLGLLHGIGLSTFYLYSLVWKKFPASVKHFLDTPVMRMASTLLTFLYVSFTSIFLLHNWEEVGTIFSILRI